MTKIMSTNPYQELPTNSDGTHVFTQENIVKMWNFGLKDDDVSYLKSLVEHKLYPGEKMTETLVSKAIAYESRDILDWLLHSQTFQKQCRTKKVIQAIEGVVEDILALDWNTQIEPREKGLFQMLDKMAPYLLGDTPFQNARGDTLPTIILDCNNYIIGEENWHAWLTQDHVFPALEVSNKKGETFFDKARAIPHDLYGGRKVDVDHYLANVEDLHRKVCQKRFGRLPQASNPALPPRI